MYFFVVLTVKKHKTILGWLVNLNAVKDNYTIEFSFSFMQLSNKTVTQQQSNT